ncbi:MAG: hypothetical protein II590_00680 [Clostridia bacterium]|nr:hypothetical protein [Clostridia bacterium]
MKKALALLLVVIMALAVFAACKKNPTPGPADTTPAPDKTEGTEPAENTEPPMEEPQDYTYNTYSTSLGNNWNPHTWETSADDAILGYLSSPFCTMQAENTEDGIYQWVYEMATEINDVTATHQEDLTKYAVNIGDADPSTITEGYVFEIKLNPNAKWEDGTPINADSYITSMKYLLDPEMLNYRANLYYAGESAVAGGNAYYYSRTEGYWVPVDSLGFESNQAALDAGVKLAIDMHNFWGLAGCKDEAGNECPQWVEITDETKYRDEAVEEGKDGDWISAADIWADYAAYFDAADYAQYCAAWKVNDNMNVDFESTVGCYKVDDYTINYVCENKIDFNYFLTSCTSTWLVYEPYYTQGFDTTGKLKTTNYGTDMSNTMSYGPYKLESLQKDKQIVFTQNPNWYGWEEQPNGALISKTPYKVNGESVQRYQTTRIVIDVMDDDAAKQAFLKGELTEWAPTPEDLPDYAASEQLYKAEETYTMSFFFHTNLEDLKIMDESKGNTNSVVLSNVNFRKAFSFAINRDEWVTATAGFKPSFGLMNDLYHYDFYNDPTSSYRSSEPAMQAICDLYGVQYGEGTPYATLKDAYKSINGYNLTLAQELMKQACDELVADGLYKAGDPIVIRIGYKKGALDSADNKQVELMNKYINAAAEGSGFGHITLEALGNINDRYGDTAKGEYAIGYGAWGGAALYPFRNFQVYCDTEQYSIHEAGCWDPSTETFTINVNGEDVTMTWQDWSRSMIGAGRFAGESNDVKLQITAAMEKAYLEFYYRIPLATSTTCSLLAYKAKYITPDYNLAYGWGGLELMTYNYSDTEWTEFVASQGGILNYQ